MIRLNGWKRLGVVLCIAWMLGVASIASYEYTNRKDGWFFGLTLPLGTIITGGKATLPDGRIVELNMALDGRPVKPWEVQWDNEPKIPTIQVIHWRPLLGALAFPLLLWVAVSLFVRIASWVRAGFRASAT
jgi:hypothetical protein